MIKNWPYIYVYATNRDDGMNYAVGMAVEDDNVPANGSVALFGQADHAELFANVLATLTGGTASVMPSVRRAS